MKHEAGSQTGATKLSISDIKIKITYHYTKGKYTCHSPLPEKISINKCVKQPPIVQPMNLFLNYKYKKQLGGWKTNLGGSEESNPSTPRIHFDQLEAKKSASLIVNP